MSRFVISREYGELVQGLRETERQLRASIKVNSEGRVVASPALAQERADWIETMKRCPMFVAQVAAYGR